MDNMIYINGNFEKREEAKVSLFDKGFLYGDGVFEGIRIYNGNIFKCKEHIDRLYNSAKALNINIGMSKQQMTDALVESVRKNNMKNGYIRLIVTRGDGDVGIDPNNVHSRPNVMIIVQNLIMFPPEHYETGINTITVATKRNIPDSLDPKIKSLNYLTNILAKMGSNVGEAHEALMLNSQGYVTEGTTDNIFIVKDEVIYTPPTYIGALEGITRQTIIDIAGKLNYTLKEEPFTSYDIYVADEVFLTGTAVEVIPVILVDGRQIGNGVPGEVYYHLTSEFRNLVDVEGVQVF